MSGTNTPQQVQASIVLVQDLNTYLFQYREFNFSAPYVLRPEQDVWREVDVGLTDTTPEYECTQMLRLRKIIHEETCAEMHSMFGEIKAIHNQMGIDLTQAINLINGRLAGDYTSGLLRRIDANYFDLSNRMTTLDKAIANVSGPTSSSSTSGAMSKLKLPPPETFSSENSEKQFADWKDAMELWMIENKYRADNQTYAVTQLLRGGAKKVAEKHLIQIRNGQTPAIADVWATLDTVYGTRKEKEGATRDLENITKLLYSPCRVAGEVLTEGGCL